MPLQHAVERQDLRPVRVLGTRALRRAPPRSLPAADTRRPSPCDSAALIERDAFGDRVPIPERAILLVERDQLAVRPGARRAPGVGQQHQRKQPGDLARRPAGGCARLASAGWPRSTRSRALQRRADAAGVALVEDQIEHVQHGARAVRRARGRSASGTARPTT